MTEITCDWCDGLDLFPPCPDCEIRAMMADDPTIVLLNHDPLSDAELAELDAHRERARIWEAVTEVGRSRT